MGEVSNELAAEIEDGLEQGGTMSDVEKKLNAIEAFLQANFPAQLTEGFGVEYWHRKRLADAAHQDNLNASIEYLRRHGYVVAHQEQSGLHKDAAAVSPECTL